MYTCLSACMRAPMCLCVSLWMYTHKHAYTSWICMHAYKHLRIAMFLLEHTIPFYHLGNKFKKQQHTNTSHLHIQSQELYTIRCVCIYICVYIGTHKGMYICSSIHVWHKIKATIYTCTYTYTYTLITHTTAATAHFSFAFHTRFLTPFNLLLYNIIFSVFFSYFYLLFCDNFNNIATRRDFHATATSGSALLYSSYRYSY